MTPAIFFTFSRSVLPTYLLPGFAGLSILAGRALWKGLSAKELTASRLAIVSIPAWIGPWIALVVSVRVEGAAAETALCLGVGIALTGAFAAALALRNVPALLGTIPLGVAGTFL